jgi:hypothetical protein
MLQRLVSRPVRLVLPALVLWMVACGGDGQEEMPGEDKCKVDADCGGATPACGAAGVCVACEANAQCSGATPVCETTTNTCRSCSADSECSSGVCLASLGTCATADQLVYVKEAGGVDNGLCEQSAPCATINYAKNRATATRNVLRVIGNLNQSGELQKKIYVDGDGGTWTAAALPVLGVGTSDGDVTIEGLTISGPAVIAANSPVVQCLNNASLRFHDAKVKLAAPGIFSVCKLTLIKSQISETRTAVQCMDSALTIEESKISGVAQKVIDASACQVKLVRNEITGTTEDQFFVAVTNPPSLVIENNLLWDKTTLTSSGISVTGAPTGGVIRFNTMVASAAGTHTGEALNCVGTSTVSSNVMAWQNGKAVGGNPCVRRYNAFDSLTPVGVGEGNTSGTLASLFVNPASDFHPAATSPALNLADPADKIAVDLDGKARPATGRLDAGAYEVQ